MDYCCEEVAESYRKYGVWQGGSHYHCGNCNKVGGMYGCYHSVHFINGKPVKVEGHFGCSEKCDLNDD